MIEFIPSEVTKLEDEYDALALIPDHRWGQAESALLADVVSRLSAAYEVAGTDEMDRIVL